MDKRDQYEQQVRLPVSTTKLPATGLLARRSFRMELLPLIGKSGMGERDASPQARKSNTLGFTDPNYVNSMNLTASSFAALRQGRSDRGSSL
jgi:hypothetical protein